MNQIATPANYGMLDSQATLTLQRILPGPIERVWDYLTDSELRRQWLAAGDMELRKGASFELVWRNDELSDPPGTRPEGFPKEHHLKSEITEVHPPHRLAFTWGNTGGVTFELKQDGKNVLLTVTHKRIQDRGSQLNIAAGWHTHLDVLAERLNGRVPKAFWAAWQSRKREYEERIPA